MKKKTKKKSYSSCKVKKSNTCDIAGYLDKYFSAEKNVPRSENSWFTSYKTI